jgi:hypothetical protein
MLIWSCVIPPRNLVAALSFVIVHPSIYYHFDVQNIIHSPPETLHRRLSLSKAHRSGSVGAARPCHSESRWRRVCAIHRECSRLDSHRQSISIPPLLLSVPLNQQSKHQHEKSDNSVHHKHFRKHGLKLFLPSKLILYNP